MEGTQKSMLKIVLILFYIVFHSTRKENKAGGDKFYMDMKPSINNMV